MTQEINSALCEVTFRMIQSHTSVLQPLVMLLSRFAVHEDIIYQTDNSS